ncbi:hypothetical protein Mal64_16750 [Pseudobythopirellula maris]|uniref:Uncharacterized protein n=1 Tax=Pseudobythopirellula maris TaxID=2527991 RepID=A0A5C5ZM86_9BACT|nr:hypothetical protein [Pseudobythopirellula maris]TWT88196.1 hypothetical protein Mal64_16750 [Pseudobythopirellula maris]
MIAQILIGVLVLTVLVAWFFSVKHWHWAHVLAVAALFFFAVGYAILLSLTFDARIKPQKALATATEKLEQQTAENTATALGTEDRTLVNRLRNKGLNIPDDAQEIGGVRELDHQLKMRNRTRGRVWRGVQPTSEVDPETGQIRIGFPVVSAATTDENAFEEQPADQAEPAPVGIDADAVLYVFEQGEPNTVNPEEGAQYLGEFRVTEAAGREATLEPVLLMDERSFNRFANSNGPWVVYETMPIDSAGLFAELSDEELRQLIPEESVEEYLRDGEEASVDDDEWRREGLDEDGKVVGVDNLSDAVRFRYRRQQRDYAYLFQEYAKEYVELQASIQAQEQDILKLQNALKSAKELTSFRQDEIDRLQKDLEGAKRDRARIERHVATLRSQIEKAERLLSATLRSNAELVSRIAERQEAFGQAVAAPRGALDVDAL